MAWSDRMNDGFAFAALLARRVDASGEGPEVYVAHGARPAIKSRLDALRSGALKAEALVPALRPGPNESVLQDAAPRVRAVVGSLLAISERRRLAHRGPLPTPRRGYEAHPDLARALARWRTDSDTLRCVAQERRELKEEEDVWAES
ncbi:MAG: hypothetical protein AB8H86_07690 [Polyangiales bacterium]